MKLLAGELPSLGGTRTEARDLRIGYFAQHQLEQLDVADSSLGNLRRVGATINSRLTEQELRDYLGSFGFRGERVFEPVAPFSGGEKARLVLALVAFLRPNLMLLDEPTNHLDLEMRQALAMALQEYTGAVVMVSHDRHLLRTVSDQFLVVHEGRAAPFDGDLEDYAKWLGETEGAAAHAQAAPVVATRAPESADERKQRRREDAERRNRLTPLRNTIQKCEARLAQLSIRAAEIESLLASQDLYLPTARDRLLQLTGDKAQVAREIEAVESQWLAASEELEQAGA